MGKSATKTTTLILKDKSKRSALKLESKSSYVIPKIVEKPNDDKDRITVEVTVTPDAPPGRLNETIIASLTDGSHQTSTLRVIGTIIGNIEVSPGTIRFTIDTSQDISEQGEQQVTVSNTRDDVSFRIVNIVDPKDILSFQVDTVVTDKKYVIKMKPKKSVLKMTKNVWEEVKIVTDDTLQPEVKFRYNINFPRIIRKK